LIPEITQNKQKPFVELVHKIMAAKKKDPKANTTEIEDKIDRMVYALYGLSAEEIAIVEGRDKTN
jgi:adenine-specific DNA-methyltransferase